MNDKGSMYKENSPHKSLAKSVEKAALAFYEPPHAYHPTKLTAATQSFIDEEFLNLKSIFKFEGEFKNPNNRKVGLVTLLDSFQELEKKKPGKKNLQRCGTKIYFELPRVPISNKATSR